MEAALDMKTPRRKAGLCSGFIEPRILMHIP